MLDMVVEGNGFKACPRCRTPIQEQDKLLSWTYVWATDGKPSGLRCTYCGLVIRWRDRYDSDGPVVMTEG